MRHYILKQVTDIHISYDLNPANPWALFEIGFIEGEKGGRETFYLHLAEFPRFVRSFCDGIVYPFSSLENEVQLNDGCFCLSRNGNIHSIKVSDPLYWKTYFSYHYQVMQERLFGPHEDDIRLEFGALSLTKENSEVSLLVDNHVVLIDISRHHLLLSLELELEETTMSYIRFPQTNCTYAVHRRVVESAIDMLHHHTIPIKKIVGLEL
ncbi:hypothetical protein K5X82_03615 [Halosquirtibacter xylanolyticus]|uniref:hypothetical protein n=1 Tax=Halosquirtibacter xylanolyticus TaxID=3374599 RepID=UPI0037490F07|nr:hypothetical protein K5X82_03615 [Prolixibacteraceae bacterium]